ncbi:hypothetical protein [Cellvibrio sp. NN19]|uniref:hypothetical protein n=1 Tax=Cellvibrio chitinivorans TaxID=3102792 RepID=UPI002B40E53F|nr:hypothetical protein [Cellvibrio sp. NN19]
MELTKFKKVNGKAVDIVPTFAGYVVMGAEKLPSIVSGLITLVLGSICGYMMVVGWVGLLAAGLVALYLSIPISMNRAVQRGEVSPFTLALICVIFFFFPLVFWVFTWNDMPWNVIFELNVKAFLILVEPGTQIIANVIMFICAIFSDYEVNMHNVLLAKKEWSYWIICTYHLAIIFPLIVGLFNLGYQTYKSKPTFGERLLLVIMMVVPMCWVWFVMKRNGFV